MILADTSVWIDHLRARDDRLAALLNTGLILCHPFVIGEVALGTMNQRVTILRALSSLPRVVVATDAEALLVIEHLSLFGRGIGYVDVHLLASVRLTAGAALWTHDKRLHAVAANLNLAIAPP